MIDDNKRGNHEQPEQLTCPICSQDFPVREIENHAASCEAYEAGSSAGRSRSNSPIIPRSSRNAKHREEPSRLWTCDICLKFTARNGKEFEDHVHSCIARVKYGGAYDSRDLYFACRLNHKFDHFHVYFTGLGLLQSNNAIE